MVQKTPEVTSKFHHPVTGKICQPSSKMEPFVDQGKIRQRKVWDGLHLSFAVPKYSRP